MTPLDILIAQFGQSHRRFLTPEQIADWCMRASPTMNQEDAMALARQYKEYTLLVSTVERLFDSAFQYDLTGYCKVAMKKGISGLAIRTAEITPEQKKLLLQMEGCKDIKYQSRFPHNPAVDSQDVSQPTGRDSVTEDYQQPPRQSYRQDAPLYAMS